jgi:hypothetical protein
MCRGRDFVGRGCPDAVSGYPAETQRDGTRKEGSGIKHEIRNAKPENREPETIKHCPHYSTTPPLQYSTPPTPSLHVPSTPNREPSVPTTPPLHHSTSPGRYPPRLVSENKGENHAYSIVWRGRRPENAEFVSLMPGRQTPILAVCPKRVAIGTPPGISIQGNLSEDRR